MSIRIVTIVNILAVTFLMIVAVLLIGSAHAQNAPTFRSRDYNPFWYWGSTPCEECRRIHRIRERRRERARHAAAYERRHHERHTRKIWRDEREYRIERDDDRHERIKCEDKLSVVGDQYASEEGAQKEADKAWMQTARWAYGERFMSRDHAKEATYECGRSSVGSVVGQVFYRCRLLARPCSAPKQRAN